MNITQQYATTNECYKSGAKLNVRRLMVHSTACPGVPAVNFANSWNTYRPNGKKVCVHAFLDDTSCYQLLPWTMQAWHCAGAGNQQAIGIELCEPSDYADRKYFEKVIKNAIEVYAYLCKQYNIDPANIISHKEGHSMGIASNHGDPDHWWKYIGYTMDNFRNDVSNCLNGGGANVTYTSGAGGGTSSGTTGTAKSGQVVYQAYAVGKWWGYVTEGGTGTESYAGVIGQALRALRAYVKGDAKEVGYLEYRLHRINGGWYNWQRDREMDRNGENYAGDRKNQFDGLQMRLVGATGKHVRYRVHCIGVGWLDWVIDWGSGANGYAGLWGKTIDAVQVEIV